MSGLFVTGTDTGVGKTVVAAGLVGALRRRGVAAWPAKPVETGGDSDARLLLACLDDATARLEDVLGESYPHPMAPVAAAQAHGRPVDVDALDRVVHGAKARGFAIVEGAGGVAVPVAPGLDMAGLAKRWGLRAVVVARPGLGTLNHTVLTTHYLRQHDVPVAGIVVNGLAEPDGVVADNLRRLPGLAGCPLLGAVPRMSGRDARDPGALADAVGRAVDLRPLMPPKADAKAPVES